MKLTLSKQPPSAIDLLKTQHELVKTLFKRIEKASTRSAKTKFFDELAANLAAHDAIEREIFYPACERAWA
ncbi:MAG: hemerythrin domain-containing protein [Pseudomonadota bacterium]